MKAPQSEAELDLRATEPGESLLECVRDLGGDVVVAGAGGKMGSHLCGMLKRAFEQLGKTNRVVAVSRFGDSAVAASFAERGIDVHPADLTTPEAVAALPDASAVFFLAGKKFGTSDAPEQLTLFNETMPAMVADRYAGVPLVAYSTGCVYPFVSPASGGSCERDPVGPSGDYAVSCYGREEALIASSQRHETPLALIRLNYSVDLRYGVLVDLATRVLAGEPIDVTMGYFNCIWQGDAIDHTIRSLAHASAAPASAAPAPCLMNVTGPRILSVREVAHQLAHLLGKKVIITGEEAETAWLNDARKSHQLFGEPTVNEETLIEWVADWVKNERPLLGKLTHFETRDGKY